MGVESKKSLSIKGFIGIVPPVHFIPGAAFCTREHRKTPALLSAVSSLPYGFVIEIAFIASCIAMLARPEKRQPPGCGRTGRRAAVFPVRKAWAEKSPFMRLEPLAVAQLDEVVVADFQALKRVAAVGVVLLDQMETQIDASRWTRTAM